MKELSLHILDLVQNSITAGAKLIQIYIDENLREDLLTIEIKDNGIGMDDELKKGVMDPFVTTRTSRKVGLGIPLMLAACKRCEGDLKIESQVNVGTAIKAVFRHSHIDRAPIGNMTDTIVSLILCCTDAANYIDLMYTHKINNKEFCFDSREIRKVLGDEISLIEPDVLGFIRDFIKEGLNNLLGGV